MPTIKEAVHSAIDQDIYLQEGFTRDILNKRAVARWLMKYRGIEGSFETIYDAVEDYDPPTRTTHLAPWEELASHWIHRARPVSVIQIQRTARSFEQMAKLFDPQVLPYQSSYRIIPSEGSVALVVEDKHQDKLVGALGEELIIPPIEEFFEFSLRHKTGPPRGDETGDDPPPEETVHSPHPEFPAGGPLALVVLAIQSAGIPVPYLANGATERFFLVPRDEKTKACKIVNELLVDPTLDLED